MRGLRPVPGVPGPELSRALLSALDGDGPAVLPMPSDPAEARRLLAATEPQRPLEDDDVCLVVPTSGSTGVPKGVLLTAASLTASARAAEQRLGGPGSWLLTLPVTSIGGLQVLLRSLLSTGEPVVGGVDTSTRDLPAGRRYVSLVPTQLRRLLASGEPSRRALATYDAVLLGGAAAPPVLLEQAQAAGVRVVTTYGMTETSGGCVYDGVPLDGVGVSLCDSGRIRLTGAVVALGYRLEPTQTAAVFDAGAFTTSDVGRLVDGRLVVDGRADDLVVTGGSKVAPLAVESVLGGHPGVAEVAVIGVPDPEWGARVVAVVVPRGRGLTLEEARAHVAARLSRTAAPRELRLVDAMPLLGSGKVDRAALQDWGTTR